MPVGIGGNPFYNPGSLYGSPQDFSTAPVIGGPGGFLDQNPMAAWTRYTSTWASPFSPQANWLNSQAYAQAYRGYQAAQPTNPSLSFHNQYLPSLTPEFFQNLWMRQAPQVRGINAPQNGGGRIQWFGG